jgi:23S rRNA (pseudouridine1915-N3)-methyltransferase
MSIRVVLLCDSIRDPLVEIAQTYLKKSGPRLKAELLNLSNKKLSRFPEGPVRRLEEGKALLKSSEGYYRIALDAKGRSMATQEWSQRLEHLLAQRGRVAFLIGGASGHSEDLLNEANEKWALSPLTFPHKLALCVLSEQIYRAAEIAKQSPYAK